MSAAFAAIVLLLLTVTVNHRQCHADNATQSHGRAKRSPFVVGGGFHFNFGVGFGHGGGGGGGGVAHVGGWHGRHPAGGRLVVPVPVLVPPGQAQPPQAPPGQTPEPWPLAVKLRMSSQLRDNLVLVFGHILNRPTLTVDVQLYVALLDLYNGARLRHIRTPELLYRLKELSFASPHQQFTILMGEMNRIVPRYLSGACSIWLEHLKQNKVNVDAILRPGGGALAADFLAGIDLSLLHLLLQPSRFKPSSTQFVSPIAVSSMGVFFNNILGAMLDGSLQLTQTIVAGFLLHLQLQAFRPEVDEARRFLADILNQERADMQHVAGAVGHQHMRDPYDLVRAALAAMAAAQQPDLNIRDAADTVLLHLKPPSFLTYNPDHASMSAIVSGPTIDYVLLFGVIRPGEFPRDIVDAKNKLVEAILRRQLQMELVTAGFVRYDYTNPRDLLLALLERVRRRGFLSPQLADAVLAIVAHLKLKMAAIDMDPWPVASQTHVIMLFNAFMSPGTPEDVRKLAHFLMDEVLKLNLDWASVLAALPAGSSSPRHRLLEVLNLLVAQRRVVDQRVLEAIEDLVRKLNDDGNPRSCPVMVCPPAEGGAGKTVAPLEITTTTTTTPMPEIPEPEKINPLIFDVDIVSLFSTLQMEEQEREKIKKLQMFLNTKDGLALLKGLNVQMYKTQADLMAAILNMLLQAQAIRANSDMLEIVRLCTKRVQHNGYGAQMWRTIVRTVDLNDVFACLDMERMTADGHGDAIDRIGSLLAGQGAVDINDVNMNDKIAATRAQFLAELFRRLSEHVAASHQDREDLELAGGYIRTSGAGAERVQYTEITV